MKNILVTPNLPGNGTTSVVRDLSAALGALKQPTPSVVSVDYASGELWRQARRQGGFVAYPGSAFRAAWEVYKTRSRHTMPVGEISNEQGETLGAAIKNGIDYLVMDDALDYSPHVSMVILVAKCDPRNLATLRVRYQALRDVNPNTYVLLTQGSSHGKIAQVTAAFQKNLTDKGVQTIRANGQPLAIPLHEQAHSLAASEGLPVFKLTASDYLTEDDLHDLRRAYHDAATEVRRLLTLADVAARREARASAGAA